MDCMQRRARSVLEPPSSNPFFYCFRSLFQLATSKKSVCPAIQNEYLNRDTCEMPDPIAVNAVGKDVIAVVNDGLNADSTNCIPKEENIVVGEQIAPVEVTGSNAAGNGVSDEDDTDRVVEGRDCSGSKEVIKKVTWHENLIQIIEPTSMSVANYDHRKCGCFIN
eukprot:Gb_17829 [translate_table: standard]